MTSSCFRFPRYALWGKRDFLSICRQIYRETCRGRQEVLSVLCNTGSSPLQLHIHVCTSVWQGPHKERNDHHCSFSKILDLPSHPAKASPRYPCPPCRLGLLPSSSISTSSTIFISLPVVSLMAEFVETCGDAIAYLAASGAVSFALESRLTRGLPACATPPTLG